MAKDNGLMPSYSGNLKPAPWAKLRLTRKNEKALRKAAIGECPSCKGRGYAGKPPLVSPCSCLNATSLPSPKRAV